MAKAKPKAKRAARKAKNQPCRSRRRRRRPRSAQGGYQYSPTHGIADQPALPGRHGGGEHAAAPEHVRPHAASRAQLGNIYGGQAAGTLGQYRQLMRRTSRSSRAWRSEIQGIQAASSTWIRRRSSNSAAAARSASAVAAPARAGLGHSRPPASKPWGGSSRRATRRSASANYNGCSDLVGAQQGGVNQLFNQGSQSGQMYGQNNMDLYNQTMGAAEWPAPRRGPDAREHRHDPEPVREYPADHGAVRAGDEWPGESARWARSSPTRRIGSGSSRRRRCRRPARRGARDSKIAATAGSRPQARWVAAVGVEVAG